MLSTAVFCIFGVITLCGQSKSLFVQQQEMVPNSLIIEKAVASILKQFFRDKILFISNYVYNENHLLVQNNILTNVLKQIDESSWYLETMQHVPNVQVKYNSVMFIDSYKAFRRLYQHLFDGRSYDTSGFYLIVLTNQMAFSYSIIQMMFFDCWSLFIVNVYIVVENFGHQVLLYSYFPFRKGHCGNTVPIVVNRFAHNMFKNPFVYHQKSSNLHGCTLNVVTWHNPPFIIVQRDERGPVYFEGIEGRLLHEIAERLNFQVNFVTAPKENPRGYIFDNGSMTGSFEMLRSGTANISIGCYRYSEIRVRHFASTHPYYQVPIVVALSRGISFTALERILYPFTNSVWAGLLAIYGLAVLITNILRWLERAYVESFVFGPDNNTPLYNMWVSFLGGQITNTPKRNFARFILILWIIFALVIRSAYQSEIYIFLRLNLDEKMPTSFADLVSGDYSLHLDPTTQDIIQGSHYLRQVCKISNEPHVEFLRRLQGGLKKSGILCPMHYVRYADKINFGNEPLFIMKERVLLQSNCVYFQKSSPLAKIFSKYIWQFRSNGIMNKWTSEFAERTESTRGQQPYPKQFTNKNLAGAYEVYGIFIVISCLVFIIEVFSMKFWKIIQKS